MVRLIRLCRRLRTVVSLVILLCPMLASTAYDLTQAQTPEQAITGMISYLNALDLDRSGRYFGHDGTEVPW